MCCFAFLAFSTVFLKFIDEHRELERMGNQDRGQPNFPIQYQKKISASSLEKMLERGSSETLLETEILGRVGMKMMEG